METNSICLLLLALVWTQCVQSQLPQLPPLPQLPENMNCQTDLSQKPFDLTAMSGYWYEIARAPNMDILKCLNVSVPSTADKELNLQVEYIETINPKKPWIVKETLSFPFNENTAKGIFTFQYESAFMTISLTYKVQFADPNHFAIICGYTPTATVPILKVFARKSQIPTQQKLLINRLLEASGYAKDIIWTEQSPERCNSAVRPEMTILTIFALVIAQTLCN